VRSFLLVASFVVMLVRDLGGRPDPGDRVGRDGRDGRRCRVESESPVEGS
jgi:hypothetical protein